MFYYNAYGLKIKSDVPLPLLVADDYSLLSTDVFINLQLNYSEYAAPPDNLNSLWRISRDNAVLTIKDLATFHMQRGKEITIHPAPSFDEKRNQLVTINSLLSIILYQRKTLVLHASCVQIDGATVAFLGRSGAGKSLSAGSLCARGHLLVTDDVAPVQIISEHAHVYPGYPMLKMIPSESAILGFPDRCNTLFHEKAQKYGCSVQDRFSTQPSPLKYIFILGFGKKCHVQRLSPKDSFMALIANSPPTIWGMLPDQLHFSHLKKLIQQVPVYSTIREESLEALPEHAQMIEEFVKKVDYYKFPQETETTRKIVEPSLLGFK